MKTGLVVWEWHAYGHIPLEESHGDARELAPPTTPSTSTRSRRSRRASCWSPLAKRLGALQGRPVLRPDRLDPGRRRQRLRARPRRPLLLPARRADATGDGRVSLFDDQAGPPAVRALLSRAGAAAARQAATRRRSSRSITARPTPRPRARAASRRCPTATSSSAGGRSRSSASSRRAGGCCSTPACPTTTAPTGSTASPGSAKPKTPPTAAAVAHRRRRSRCTRAGTGPPRSPAGRCWRETRPVALAPLATAPRTRVRDPDRRRPPGRARSRSGRSTPTARCSRPRIR